MTPHLILARLCFAVAAVLTLSAVWHIVGIIGKERAKERRVIEAMRDMPLTDYCAHVAARDLDGEWLHLATLALTDWPPMPEDTADLPRTW